MRLTTRLLYALLLSGCGVPAMPNEESRDNAIRYCQADPCDDPPPRTGGSGGTGGVGGSGGAGGSGGGSVPNPAPRYITETLVDRCSADVAISRVYDEAFGPYLHGLYLSRDATGYTPWSALMPVSGSSYIRWWCNSTSGNWLDPGTWRISLGLGGIFCAATGDDGEGWDDWNVEGACVPLVEIHTGSSDVDGWTPERSRCSSPTTRAIQARLGPDRLLEMRCLE